MSNVPSGDPLSSLLHHAVRHERPQMADVARMAGVSTASVSRALNGGKGVGQRTRARIEAVARALHYEVDDSARRLRRGETRSVAIVVCSGPQCPTPFESPGVLGLLGGIAAALTELGIDMVLSSARASSGDDVVRDFEAGRAKGLIVIGQFPQETVIAEMAARRVPIVMAPDPGSLAAVAKGRELVRALISRLHAP